MSEVQWYSLTVGLHSKTFPRMQSVSSQQDIKNSTLVDRSKSIQIYWEFIEISQSIVKPNLPQPLPPQYVPTAVYVYVYIVTRVRLI